MQRIKIRVCRFFVGELRITKKLSKQTIISVLGHFQAVHFLYKWLSDLVQKLRKQTKIQGLQIQIKQCIFLIELYFLSLHLVSATDYRQQKKTASDYVYGLTFALINFFMIPVMQTGLESPDCNDSDFIEL